MYRVTFKAFIFPRPPSQGAKQRPCSCSPRGSKRRTVGLPEENQANRHKIKKTNDMFIDPASPGGRKAGGNTEVVMQT